jgi:hypothetical protein
MRLNPVCELGTTHSQAPLCCDPRGHADRRVSPSTYPWCFQPALSKPMGEWPLRCPIVWRPGGEEADNAVRPVQPQCGVRLRIRQPLPPAGPHLPAAASTLCLIEASLLWQAPPRHHGAQHIQDRAKHLPVGQRPTAQMPQSVSRGGGSNSGRFHSSWNGRKNGVTPIVDDARVTSNNAAGNTSSENSVPSAVKAVDSQLPEPRRG